MMSKDETNSVSSMVQNQKTWLVATWITLFFVGLLLIPTAIYLSTTWYPAQPAPQGWLAKALYFCGFWFLVGILHEMTTRRIAVGVIALVVGLIMAFLPTAPMIMVAGAGIGAAGLSNLLVVVMPRKTGGGKASQTSHPSTRLFSRRLEGFACAALLLISAICIPGTCFAMSAIGGKTASANISTASEITIGQVTIEMLSNTSLKITDTWGTLITMVFLDATHILLNGTVVELPRLQSSVRTASRAGVCDSGTFWWDCLQYTFGHYVAYPHVDRDRYNISPYSDSYLYGSSLLHYQVNSRTSDTLVSEGLPLLTAAIGMLIGTLIADVPVGTIVGLIVGAILGIVIYNAGADMLDEHGCLWWLISRPFIQWLKNNALMLEGLYIASPPLAIAAATNEWSHSGYMLMGKTLFYDALGIGRPAPPNQDNPKPGTVAFHLRFPGGSRGCLVR